MGTFERKRELSVMSKEEQMINVSWMRESEIKHARLAMLAAVGWPLAELFSPSSLSASAGRAPSLFNGGLFDYPPFLLLAVAEAARVESQTAGNIADSKKSWASRSDDYVEGKVGFDPMGSWEGGSPADRKNLQS